METRKRNFGTSSRALDEIERRPPPETRKGGSPRQRRGIAIPAALLSLLLAVAAAGGFKYNHHRLSKLPRARQNPADWLETSAAKDQDRLRVLGTSETRFDVQLECRPNTSGFLAGKSCSPPPHVHGKTTEYLTVQSGTLRYTVNGTEATATASTGSVRIDPGTEHTWWNAEPSEKLDLIATYLPPGRFDKFFKTIAGLGHDHGSFQAVPLLQWIVTFEAVDMRPAQIPPAVWNTVVRWAVVPLAKAAGFRAFEDEY